MQATQMDNAAAHQKLVEMAQTIKSENPGLINFAKKLIEDYAELIEKGDTVTEIDMDVYTVMANAYLTELCTWDLIDVETVEYFDVNGITVVLDILMDSFAEAHDCQEGKDYLTRSVALFKKMFKVKPENLEQFKVEQEEVDEYLRRFATVLIEANQLPPAAKWVFEKYGK
jgi:hypothetical protein